MFARLAGYGVISLLLKWFAMDFLQEYESSDSEATDVYNSTNIDVKASDRGGFNECSKCESGLTSVFNHL